MMKASNKKLLREVAIYAIILIVLFGTNLHTTLGSWMQMGLLKTGLLDARPSEDPIGHFDYNLKLVNEKQEILEPDQFEGKTLFINFWATWCAPCVAEMPEIESIYNQLDNDKFKFLMISVDDSFDAAREFKNKRAYTFPIYQLAASPPQVFRGNSIPRTYVVDSHGNVLYEKAGIASYDNADFLAFLESLD